jgi:hypothetical protein
MQFLTMSLWFLDYTKNGIKLIQFLTILIPVWHLVSYVFVAH